MNPEFAARKKEIENILQSILGESADDTLKRFAGIFSSKVLVETAINTNIDPTQILCDLLTMYGIFAYAEKYGLMYSQETSKTSEKIKEETNISQNPKEIDLSKHLPTRPFNFGNGGM